MHQFNICQFYVVRVFCVLRVQLLVHELAEVLGVALSRFFERALLGEEGARVAAEVVVEDDDRAHLLYGPYFLVELGVLLEEQLPVERVVDQ